MNKKQRNRKSVTQNNRNRIINRRYSSTIKTLFKLLLIKSKTLSQKKGVENDDFFQKEKQTIQTLGNNLYSIIDKAIKKTVIHKNTASRKKSRISKIISAI